ncbi:hypothetical protein ACO0SA_004206 [Hanseniaspora valbyensis]
MAEIPKALEDKFSNLNYQHKKGYTFLNNVTVSRKIASELLEFIKKFFFVNEDRSRLVIKDRYLLDDLDSDLDDDIRYHISLKYNNNNNGDDDNNNSDDCDDSNRDDIINTPTVTKLHLKKSLQVNTDTSKPIIKLLKGNIRTKIFIALILENNEQLLEYKASNVPYIHISVAHFYYNIKNGLTQDEFIEAFNENFIDADPNITNQLIEIIHRFNDELTKNNKSALEIITC